VQQVVPLVAIEGRAIAGGAVAPRLIEAYRALPPGA